MSVRVRYAPSPTGYLHIGNARTALYNYLFARKNGGSFILRIEDTDVERNVEDGIESQQKYLQWLGIEWDESMDKDGGYGPYRQLERLDIYQKYADILLEKGYAYKCYCTPEELEEEREDMKARGEDKLHYSRKCIYAPEQDKPYVLRFKVPENVEYTFTDIVKGEVTFKSEDVGDWVMMKNNGIPTYNFACAIDDHLMEITHVFRGEEHITNTPRQMMVFDAFDWDIPTYAHMTLIVNDQGKKMSKRDADIIQFIEQYQALGYLPDALFNFISLLGWSPEGEEEILSHEELIEKFDERRLSKSPARFDVDKLAYINNRYIKELTLEETVELCMPHLIREDITDGSDEEWVNNLVSVFRDRMSYGAQIVELYDEFFDQEFVFDDEMKEFMTQDGINDTLIAFRELLVDLDDFTAANIKPLIKETGKISGAKGKLLFMPLRIATTASMHGPDLPQVLALLGKDTVLERLNEVIQ
jgi:nondiscriminating glutamyl-tRNA synthetase